MTIRILVGCCLALAELGGSLHNHACLPTKSLLSTTKGADLVRAIYSAATEPDQWHEVLERIRVHLGAEVSAFLVADDALASLNIAVAIGRDRKTFEDYDRHWGRYDPWLASGSTLLKTPGEIYAGQALVLNEKIERTAFYQEFLRPNGLYQILSATVEYAPGFTTYLTANFDCVRGKEFSTTSLRFLAEIAPHIRSAVRLHRRLGQAEAQDACNRELLERIFAGVFLLDGKGRVRYMNRAAEELINLGGRLGVRCDRLYCREAKDDQALQHAIQRALELSATGTGLPPPAVSIGDHAKALPTLARAIPLPGGGHAGFAEPEARCLVIVSTGDDSQPGVTHLLTRTFGLTKAEARIAVAVASGQDLTDVAAEFEITTGTLRTHLKRIYSKVGVNGRAGLFAIVRSLAPLT